MDEPGVVDPTAFDPIAGQAALARKKQLIEMLANLAQQPHTPQFVPGAPNRANIFGPIAQALTGGLAGWQQGKLDSQETQYKKDYATGSSAALQRVSDAATAQDPRAALTSTLATLSGYPEAQKFALKRIEDLTKPPEAKIEGGMAYRIGPDATVTPAGDFRQPKSEVKDGYLNRFDPQGNLIGRDYVGEKYAPGQTPSGGTAYFGGASGKPIFEPKGTSLSVTNIPENKGAVAGAEAEAKAMVDRLATGRQKAMDALTSLDSIKDSRALLKSGIKSGITANVQLGLAKLGTQMGYNDKEVANTEAFIGDAARRVGLQIKAFGAGTGLSDKDREYAEQASAGKITLNAESLSKLLDLQEKAAKNLVLQQNRDAAGAKGKFGFQDPQAAFGVPTQGSEPMSVDDYLKANSSATP